MDELQNIQNLIYVIRGQQLTKVDFEILKSQIVTSKTRKPIGFIQSAEDDDKKY